MGTDSQLTFDFNNAKKQAEDLMALSKSIKRLAETDLAEVKTGIQTAWTSDNSSRYLNKVGKVQNQILTSAADLEKIALAIVDIAAKTYNAETNACGIANGTTGM